MPRHFLAYYAIKMSDLGPHNIEQLATFVAFCESYLGSPPYFLLWMTLFQGRLTWEKTQGPILAAGGVTF